MKVSRINTNVLVLLLIACSLLLGCSTLSNREETNQAYNPPGIGDKAPGFWMKNQEQLRVSLSDFARKKNVILVFFPLAFTPV